MIELRCESAPVAANEEFVQLANDLAQQLATGPGAATPEALLAQPSPSKPGSTLKQQFDDLNNRIREVFKLERIVRIDGPCGGYAHHNGAAGVLLQFEGGNAELAKDICMHVAAMRPAVLAKEELDPAVVAKEREILSEAARKEGKPEKIIDKMVEGRLRNFYAECCLAEQPFVKDDKKTVGQVAKEAGMKLVRFVRWEVGEGVSLMSAERAHRGRVVRRTKPRGAEDLRRGLRASRRARHRHGRRAAHRPSRPTTPPSTACRSPSSSAAATSSAGPSSPPAIPASTRPRPITWACWPR